MLPALGATVIGFMLFVWFAWVGRADGRALKIEEPETDLERDPGGEQDGDEA